MRCSDVIKFKTSEDYDSIITFSYLNSKNEDGVREFINIAEKQFSIELVKPNNEILRCECENIIDEYGDFAFEFTREMKKEVGVYEVMVCIDGETIYQTQFHVVETL